MISRIAIVAAILLPLPALASQRVSVVTTQKSDFGPGGTVRIENSTGELNVEGWDQSSVEIEVIRYKWADNEAKAKADLGRIDVSQKLEGRELVITTAHKRFTGAHVDYRIRVPRNTNLVVHQGIGAITIYNVAGDIDAGTRTGDVLVQLPEPARYEILANTKVGPVYSDFVAPLHHDHAYLGESQKPVAQGEGEPKHINLHVGIGGISIQKMTAAPLLSLK